MASSTEIIHKLECVFGDAASGDAVMQEFYSERQRANETVTEWGLRIEELLQRAIEKGHVDELKKQEMLCNKFWKFLFSERFKNTTNLKYHKCKSFDELRRIVKAQESELKTLDQFRKSGKYKAQTHSPHRSGRPS